ncbi:MAG: Clp protease N-terminal domain-containing protein [Solirubrobacteraceae bacterium]
MISTRESAQALNSLQITIERVRGRVLQLAAPNRDLPSPQTPGGEPFTPRGMRVLERAASEATTLGSDRVETEDVLLALMRERDGVAASILREHGVDPERIQNELIRLSRPEEPRAAPPERRRHSRG